MRPLQLWAAPAVVLAVIVGSCSSGSKSPTVPSVGSGPTTTAAGGGSSGGATALAEGLAYSQCMRNHGAPNWPDPVLTPHGDYGFRTTGINPQSAAFRGAVQACKALVPQWWSSTGQQLSAAEQQAWLDWAKCIRSHGVPDFPDPKFSGSEVQISGGGGSSSPVPQPAMDACKSKMPSAGGLGG